MNETTRLLKFNSEMLLWFDLETTGLDEKTEVILEVGWGITGFDLEWILEPISYLVDANIIFQPTRVEVKGLGKAHDVDPYVYKMHQQSGLWQDLMDKKRLSLSEVERTILSVLNINSKAKITMAGAGVAQYDMRWIKYHMPDLHARLTYYTIDTGIHERVESLVRRREIRGPSSTAKHRSVDDILQSHERLIRYRTEVLTGVAR